MFVSPWGCSNQTVVAGPLGIVISRGSTVQGRAIEIGVLGAASRFLSAAGKSRGQPANFCPIEIVIFFASPCVRSRNWGTCSATRAVFKNTGLIFLPSGELRARSGQGRSPWMTRDTVAAPAASWARASWRRASRDSKSMTTSPKNFGACGAHGDRN